MKTYNSKYDDDALAYQVRLREAIRRRHMKLAARYEQRVIAEALGLSQAQVSLLVRGHRPLLVLTPEQRAWAIEQYERCQHHKARARQHNARLVCRDLGICLNTRIRILKGERPEPAPKAVPSVNRFLTMRLSA